MNNASLFFFKISRVLCEVDASALTPCLWFDDESLKQPSLFGFIIVGPNGYVIIRVEESSRDEVELFREGVFEGHDGGGKCIFP